MALNECLAYCRLCHSNIGTILINENDNELLRKITNIRKVEEIEMPPNIICSSCQQKIIEIRNFIDMVEKNNEYLQHLGRSRTIQKIYPDNGSATGNMSEILKCEECLSMFTEKAAYEEHISTHLHSGMSNLDTRKGFTCAICSETYQDLSSYNSHKTKFCKTQGKTVSKIVETGELRTHRDNTRSMTKETRRKQKDKITIEKLDHLVVEDANRNSEESRNVEERLEKSSKIYQNYSCIDKGCSRIFSSQYSLKVHQLNHEGSPRPFLCVTCGKNFATRNSLSCHEKIHLDIKGYRCDLCNIDFSVRSNLRAHIRKYHEGIRFQCSQCTKQFLTKCSLERHEKMHTGIKEFKCENCKAEFYTNKELMKHQRYHQGLKQHKCQECFKAFFERHHLIVHLRSHSGEKPYVCKFPGCGKSFVESQKLKRHNKAKHIVN